MALTRAQLLSGNQSVGAVLQGQPQGVIQGAGITISTTGIISVNASTTTGLVKLNNPFGYNAYVWPGADGTAGEFLKTDGQGNLDWATPQGFAVVTVSPQPAPVPTDVGELWFDCDTGTLNVYQNCVGTPSPNWFNVAQPGLPVDPANTTASPPFTNQGTPNAGTQANPYDCAVTTVGSGSSVFVVNTVIITGLAPFQYVPIVDLNVITNGGRFSFTNNYADAGGVLTFQTVFKDLPASPPSTAYTAAIKVGYGTVYIDSVVNVVSALSLPAGTITGTPTVGTPVAYTPGVASGGTPAYSYTYEWFRDGVSIAAPSANPAYTPVAADVGKILSVKQVVTDSTLATADATTTASAATGYAPIPPGTWNPGNAMNNSVPGTSSASWGGPTGIVTSDGCVVLSTNGTNWSQSVTATNGQPLFVQWDMANANVCGLAASGTTIQGKVTSAIGQNSYLVVVNRKPAPSLPNISDTNVALGATVSKSLGTTVQGINTTAYITLGAASTGTNVKVSLDGGTTFVTVPSAPSTSMPVTLGQTIIIKQTVGNSPTVGYTAIINVGDSTGSAGSAATFQAVTYTATTVSSAVFPNTTFNPTGGPNAAPPSVNSGSLKGTATATWNDGTTSLTITGPLVMTVNGGAPKTSASPAFTVNNTDAIAIYWDLNAVNAAADNAVLTGSFGNGTYQNSYSLTVTRTVAAYNFTNLTGQSLTTAVTSNIVTPTGFNVPVTLSAVATPAPGLTSIQAAVGPGAFAALNQTVNPGDTIQLKATTGNTVSTTYSLTTTLGTGANANDVWSVATAAGTPTITAPTIQTPAAGATGVGTASGITITGSAYANLNGAGTPQTSSKWEVYKNGYPLTSANKITGVASTAAPWTASASIGSYGDLGAAAWDGGSNLVALAYASGGSYGTAYSTDKGVNWVAGGSIGISTDAWPKAIAYGQTASNATPRWVVVGDSGNLAYTSNPTVTWSQTTIGSDDYYAVTAGSNYWLAVGFGGGTGGYLYSTNGGTGWAGSEAIWVGETPRDVAYGAGKFVVVTSLAKWNTISDPVSPSVPATTGSGTMPGWGANYPLSVAYGAGKFVAVGTGGLVSVSTDGSTWSNATQATASTAQFSNVSYGGGLFVASRNTSAYAYSTDGITWTDVTKPAAWGTNSVINLTFAGTQWAATGGSGGAIGAAYYSASPAPLVNLTIANCQTGGFLVGDTVISDPAAGGPATITSLDDTQVTVTTSTGWLGDSTQSLKRDPASYSAVTGSPFNVSSAPFTSLTIAKPPLEANTKYWVRAQYATTNPTATTSAFGAWSDFTTGSLTAPLSGFTLANGPITGKYLCAPTVALPTGTILSVEQSPGSYTVRSTNGVTWSNQAWAASSVLQGVVAVNPAGEALYYVGGAGATRFRKTTDGGATYTDITAMPSPTPNFIGTMAGGDGAWLVGGNYTPSSPQWFRSTTGNGGWTKITTLSQDPAGSANIGSTHVSMIAYSSTVWYALGLSVAGVFRLVKSTDNGLTWSIVSNDVPTDFSFNPAQNGSASYLAVDKNGSTIMFGGADSTNSNVAVLRSADGGVTWNRINVAVGGVVSGKGICTLSYGGGRWVASGPTTSLSTWTSTDDGLTWSAGPAKPGGASSQWVDLRWAPQLNNFVATVNDYTGFSGAGTGTGYSIYLAN